MPVRQQARDIGTRLRTERESAGLSVAELAERASIDEATVSEIEEGAQTPSVGILLNLARALGVPAGHFFEMGTPPRRIEVVRAGERWHIERASSESGTSLSYSYEALSYRVTEKLMQPFLIEVRLGLDQPVQPSHHDGEEFLYVLEGEVEIDIQGEKIRLGRGDSVYFDSRLPHILRAASAKPPKLIAVVATREAAPSTELTRAF
jgi:transcriptional regulator with XRE-family HTH domain